MPTIGDDNIDWDAEAERASKVNWPYVDEAPLQYLQSVVPDSPILLDLGCNIGSWHYAWKTFRPNCKYNGLDFSEYALGIARERYPESGFIFCKATEMGFKEQFDVIFTHAVLQHNNRGNVCKILLNCCGALKQGGILILQENIQNNFSKMIWIDSVNECCFRRLELILYKDFNDGGAGFVFRKI